jgi:FkbM family methyltransferase
MDLASIRLALRKAEEQKNASHLRKLLVMPHRLLLSKLAPRLSPLIGPVRRRARLFTGQPMSVMLPDPVSTTLYGYGYTDGPVCHMLLDHAKPGGTVFDIGAQFGFFTLLGAAVVGESGQVHAFEPTPSTFQMLERNTRDLPNVRRNNCAVSDRDGELEFSDFGLRYCAFNTLGAPRLENLPPPARIRVKTFSLDAYCQANAVRPTFVKIDAENAEAAILRGMSSLLRDPQPPALAVEAGDASALEILAIVEPFGYRMWIYDEDGTSRPSPDPQSDIVRYKDVLFVR